MEYATLGTTGMQVSRLGLGTMMLGAWGNRDEADCIRIINTALDAGITLVDTADVYAFGESESIVGKALKGRRDRVILATKVHGPMGDDINRRGSSRRWIMRACDESLERLQTEWIDLYQLHQHDPTVDIDDTLGALSDLIHAGKVRAIGTSNFQAEELVEALWTAERRGRERIRSNQPPYSIFVRGAEVSVLPTCRRHGLGVVTYSPLNGGWLSGRVRKDRPLERTGRTEHYPEKFDPTVAQNQRKLDAVEELVAVAAGCGLSLLQLALGFVTAHPVVSSVLLGPRTIDQLNQQLGAADVHLEDGVLARIDATVPPGTVIDLPDYGYRPAPAHVEWFERSVGRVM
jgi:aryl-alcohol dehydrogenase-like predicted oxidoreductase